MLFRSDISDEEQSYLDWIALNKNFVSQNKESIHVMKKLYLAGFAAGYIYKGQNQAQEQLQK